MKKLFSLLTLALLATSAWAVDYVKVTNTAGMTSGQYLIVYEDGGVAFDGSLSTLDAVNNSITVEIADGKIASTETVDASAFTYDATVGSFKSASGFYIGKTSDSNGMNTNATTAYTNTVTFDADGNALITSQSGAVLRFNSASDQQRFRYFKSSSYTNQKAIQVYRLDDGGTPIINVAAPVFNPADGTTFTESQEITLTCATEGAAIKCSTDGLAWQDYDEPIVITATTTVYAKAVLGEVESAVVSATYTKVEPVTGNVVTFDATVDIPGVTSSAFSLTKGDVTFAVSNGTCESNTGHYRIFKNQTASFTSAGANIVKIVFTCTTEGDAQYGPGCFAVNDNNGEYTFSGKVGTWVGNAKTVVFNTNANQARPITIVVTLDDGTTQFVAAPTLPASQTFEENLTVAITNNDADATVYYSYDNVEWNPYTTPLLISETKTVYAKAVKGTAESSVVSATYTKVEPVVGDAITFVAETDTIEGGTTAGWHEITKGCVTMKFYGTVSNYALYDSLGNMTSEFHEYRIYKNNSIQFTSNGGNIRQIVFTCSSSNPATGFDAHDGLTVEGNNGVWVGKTRDITFTTYPKQVRCTQIEVTVDDEVPSVTLDAPTIDPANNTKFAGTQLVTITCATEGATIYYSTDGENFTQYNAPFTVGSDMETGTSVTVSAYSMLNDEQSSTVTATYKKITSVSTIAAANALANKTDFMFYGNVVVTYQNGSNLWIRDASGSGLIYGNQVPQFAQGTVLAEEWDAQKYDFRGGLVPEFQYPNNVKAAEGEELQTVEPFERETIELSNVNEYVIMKGLTVIAETNETVENYQKYFYNAADSLVLYNQFGVEFTIEDGKTYDVVGTVTVYNEKPQLYIISVTESENTQVKPGDVNMDGVVNIGDVSTLIAALLNSDFNNISIPNADMNGTGSPDMGDLSLLIGYLLSM